MHTARMFLIVGLTLVWLALSAAPGAAQAAKPDEARAAELRKWYDGLEPRRQRLLEQRLRVFRRLPRERQEDMLRAAREKREILSQQQRENLTQLKSMPYLQRMRLYTLARELEMLSKGMPVMFKQAMEHPERERKVGELLLQQRVQATLTPEQREEFRKLPPNKKPEFLREHREQNARERLARIEGLKFLNPRFDELVKSAATGDQDSQRELVEARNDLATLDMLLQRLTPDRREKVTAEVRTPGKNTAIEAAADMVKRELNAQYNETSRKRQPNQPKDGRRNGDRQGMAPRDERRKQ